jgi:F-type H+-transporting ATPase subunit delta
MKATATQYAKSLYGATKDKSHKKIDDVVANFLKIVDKNGQLKLKNGIIVKFGQIYNAENGIVEAEVVSREKLKEGILNDVRTYVRRKFEAEEVVLKNVVCEKIKGGIIIRVGDEVMDGSVERQLTELKKTLIQ